MALREDLSDSNLDFHETLSRLSATSKGNGTERIKDWINNSPNGAEANLQPTNPTTSASTNPYGIQIPPQQAETQVTNEAVATNSDPSAVFVPTLSSQLPVFNITNNHQTPAVQTPKTLAATVVVPAPATVQPTLSQPVPTTTTQATTIQSQVLLHPPPVPINPTLTVPVSHILPNLSAWTFPSVTSNPPTQVSTALPPNQPQRAHYWVVRRYHQYLRYPSLVEEPFTTCLHQSLLPQLLLVRRLNHHLGCLALMLLLFSSLNRTLYNRQVQHVSHYPKLRNYWLQQRRIAYQSGNCPNTTGIPFNGTSGSDSSRALLTLPLYGHYERNITGDNYISF